MSETALLPTYNSFSKTLKDLEIAISAAEAHGLLCGLLCGQEGLPLQNWLEFLQDSTALRVDKLPKEARQALQRVASVSESMLRDGEPAMSLLLPDEDLDLTVRAEGLSEWCHGFVTGFGLSGCYVNQESNQEAAEVLKDLVDIGKIVVSEEESEEEQAAFTEVVEYVEAAVLMLYGSMQFTGEGNELLTNSVH